MHFLICIIACIAFASAQNQPERCATDMVFLVDQSSSITPVNYKQGILPFLANLTNGLSLSDNGDRVAFVPFSDVDLTHVGFYFNEHHDKDSVIRAINSKEYQGGDTATVAALKLAQNRVFIDTNGARTTSYGHDIAPTLLIITDGIATDGKPDDNAATVAKKLRNDKVSIFAIGVGSLIDETYLVQLTGDDKRVFSVSDYKGLNIELANAILESTTGCGHRSGIFRKAN